MNRQFECNIILDLLPLYMDGVTSSDTDAVIREHLEKCEVCKNAYEAMADEMDLGLRSKKKRKCRKFRYRKKSAGRMLLLGYIVFLLLIMAFCVLYVVLFL